MLASNKNINAVALFIPYFDLICNYIWAQRYKKYLEYAWKLFEFNEI
jgi:hypothetical protein